MSIEIWLIVFAVIMALLLILTGIAVFIDYKFRKNKVYYVVSYTNFVVFLAYIIWIFQLPIPY